MKQQHEGAVAAPTEYADAPPFTLAALRLSACAYSEPALDDAIAASFPASDPPSWTGGIATAAPFVAAHVAAALDTP